MTRRRAIHMGASVIRSFPRELPFVYRRRSVEYAIQRRRVYLTPADPDDFEYVLDAFQKKELWQMFGFTGPGRLRIIELREGGNLVLGILRRVDDRKRIG